MLLYRLTRQIHRSIVAYVRAGSYPHVAAQAAGVAVAVFQRWLALGESNGRRYRRFALDVRQAHAQARVSAEMTIHDDKPLDWLRCGPGKETTDTGWTTTAKPRAGGSAALPLMDAHVRQFLVGSMTALEPWPEAREALAEWLNELRPGSDVRR